MRVTPNLLRHIEQSAESIAGLAERGVDPGLLGTIVAAVDDFTVGYAIRERSRGSSRRSARGGCSRAS